MESFARKSVVKDAAIRRCNAARALQLVRGVSRMTRGFT